MVRRHGALTWSADMERSHGAQPWCVDMERWHGAPTSKRGSCFDVENNGRSRRLMWFDVCTSKDRFDVFDVEQD